jgi:hypothetical protein
MRNRLVNVPTAFVWVRLLLLSAALVACPLVTLAGTQAEQFGARDYSDLPFSKDGFITLESAPEDGRLETASIRFDPHDLSGIYRSVAGGWESLGPNVPPMTVEGRSKLSERVSADNVPNPALSNDPQFSCDPQGFPRLWLDQELIENIHLEDRLLQLSQWDQTLREIWMDGRPLPTSEDIAELGQTFYGYSVGRWEGDTLVVETVGLDERNWIDDDTGYPFSSEARFEERYRRVAPDVITVQYTLYDPQYYATPWVGDVKPWRRMPRALVTHVGWFGLFSGVTEAICAPMNEAEFHERNFPAYEDLPQP